MKTDRWVRRWWVAGSNNKQWVVAIDYDGNYGCSCPIWKFKRMECHHIQKIKTYMGVGSTIVLDDMRKEINELFKSIE